MSIHSLPVRSNSYAIRSGRRFHSLNQFMAINGLGLNNLYGGANKNILSPSLTTQAPSILYF
ncbi:hypothetical protein vBSsoS008_032 [Shigella phage vB_SsoS_008]|nr:hypothetical protein vBSsoS008_032 [Shigella phage vB_SsoS_008]